MIKKRVLGIVISIIGLILIINSQISILGAVIGLVEITSGISLVVGLVFVGVGIGIFILAKDNEWDKYRVGLVMEEYESGNLNPIQAVIKINYRLFPSGIKINGVEYHGENKETIRTQRGYFPVTIDDEDKARDLAVALYEMAIINDRKNAKNCELHLSRKASSKDHKKGLTDIIQNFETKYKKELESIKKAAA